MLPALLALLTGLMLLVWAADRLLEGAVALAQRAQLAPLLVGLVVVGFGASSAELAVATAAAWHGHPALALGSAWGGNIVAMSLVLGVTVLVRPIRASSAVLHRELPLLLAATVLTALLVWDGVLSRLDALGLLAGFVALLAWSWRQTRGSETDELAQETVLELPVHALTTGHAVRRVLLALLVLALGAGLLVWGAVDVAHGLGVSDLTLGLGVVALGITLPSLATCVAAARKGEDDIALGHVLGAGLFNTLAVAGLAGLIEPLDVPTTVLWRDLPVMAGLALVLYLRGRDARQPTHLGKTTGHALVAVYLLHALALVVTSGPG
jgi:cation:H+ antiporter